jgi:hypothetical protein
MEDIVMNEITLSRAKKIDAIIRKMQLLQNVFNSNETEYAISHMKLVRIEAVMEGATRDRLSEEKKVSA